MVLAGHEGPFADTLLCDSKIASSEALQMRDFGALR